MLKRKLLQEELNNGLNDSPSMDEGCGDDIFDESSSSSSCSSDVDDVSSPNSSTLISKKDQYERKIKVMALASRGINARQRHLLDNLCALMPHHLKESKFDAKRHLTSLNELAELNSSSHTIFLESRNHNDLYLWLSKCPTGPSVRFEVQNIHTLEELSMTGNCMKYTRPLLTWDPIFSNPSSSLEHLSILRDLLIKMFSPPQNHRRTRPFHDRVMHFAWCDDRIWIRNYEIKENLSSDSILHDAPQVIDGMGLEEIGPRMVLQPIRVFEGSFGGKTLWKNEAWMPSSVIRVGERVNTALKHKQRLVNTEASYNRRQETSKMMPKDPLSTIYND